MGYDGGGNLVEMTESWAGGTLPDRVVSLSYDKTYRLLEESVATAGESVPEVTIFSYDKDTYTSLKMPTILGERTMTGYSLGQFVKDIQSNGETPAMAVMTMCECGARAQKALTEAGVSVVIAGGTNGDGINVDRIDEPFVRSFFNALAKGETLRDSLRTGNKIVDNYNSNAMQITTGHLRFTAAFPEGENFMDMTFKEIQERSKRKSDEKK